MRQTTSRTLLPRCRIVSRYPVMLYHRVSLPPNELASMYARAGNDHQPSLLRTHLTLALTLSLARAAPLLLTLTRRSHLAFHCFELQGTRSAPRVLERPHVQRVRRPQLRSLLRSKVEYCRALPRRGRGDLARTLACSRARASNYSWRSRRGLRASVRAARQSEHIAVAARLRNEQQ